MNLYVKPIGREDSRESLCSGLSYAALNESIVFEIGDGVGSPMEVSFSIKEDKSRKSYILDRSDAIDKKIELTYYNPGTKSGMLEPVIIAQNATNFVQMIFQVDRLSSGGFCCISYEFFSVVKGNSDGIV